MVVGGMCCCGGLCMVAGGCVWLWGACMVAGGACMVAGGVCVVVGGCAWLPGGMCVWGACMVAGGHAWLQGGMHVCGGCAWWQGDMHGIRQDTVNERVVRILLECILGSTYGYVCACVDCCDLFGLSSEMDSVHILAFSMEISIEKIAIAIVHAF